MGTTMQVRPSSSGSVSTGHERDLIEEIEDIMDSKEIGLEATNPASYLPDTDRKRLVSFENTHRIHRVLHHTHHEMIPWIVEHAPRTFVTVALVFQSPDKRPQAIAVLRDTGFTDACLPVEGSFKCRKPDHNHHNLYDDPERSPFWKPRDWLTFGRNFCEKQWSQLVQTFYVSDDKMPELYIERKRLLPFFDSRKEGGASGYFGDVVPARMVRSYQDTIHSEEEIIDIAIKTLKDSTQFSVEVEWRREVAAHQALGQLKHRHIVRAIAAYKHRESYCLLFEWADLGNLRSHWNETKHQGLSAKIVEEYLEQLHGLADALEKMHNTKRARSKSPGKSSRLGVGGTDVDARSDGRDLQNTRESFGIRSDEDNPDDSFDGDERPLILVSRSTMVRDPTLDPQEIEPTGRSLLRVGTNEEENWRHGDIKPDNILRFTDADSEMGILKLADLGRAKQNRFVTQDRPEKEFDRWRTKPYEPPDLYVDERDRNMSRLFDVWSLGCVFFESVIWMLYGEEWLRTFSGSTDLVKHGNTAFWVKEGNRATMSPVVRECFEHIFRNDPECNGEQDTALKDLALLVRDKMLVVDLPPDSRRYTEGKRANADFVTKELDRIIKKASKDTNYLFAHQDRSGLKSPPSAVQQVDASSALPNGGISHINEPSTGAAHLGVPVAHQVGIHTRRMQTYSEVPENKWRYINDDKFAVRVYQENADAYKAANVFPNLDRQLLCTVCGCLDFRNSGQMLSRDIADLTPDICDLCAVLSDRAKRAELNKAANLTLCREESRLVVGSGQHSINDNLHLRLCRTLAFDGVRASASSFITSGLPRIPTIDQPAMYTTIRAWLNSCNRGHRESDTTLDCMSPRPSKARPTRLLCVGSVGDHHSRIVETSAIPEPTYSATQYLALSPPWGKNTKSNPHFVSTVDNISQHMEKIKDNDLPRNFRDAVVVTRELHVRYLWIDALCILQKTDTHAGDFQNEAGLMQDIFSSAYCVLAASSATGMHSGFLTDGLSVPRSERRAIRVNSGDSSDVFACESPDNFEHDVLNGPLSSRAWVLQERALARRTVFFTNNQMYWECSDGIRCESMSKLWNSEVALWGDSNFPDYVVKDKTKGARISLFKRLYTDFCRLKFSHATDKPFAISGLEQRLTDRFDDISGAGVFGKHKGRCLLWRRASGEPNLERIDYDNATSETHKPPSWSFMAHIGRIEYIDVPGHKVDWAIPGLHLTGTADTSWLYAAEPLVFHADAHDFEVRPDASQAVVVYDVPASNRQNDRCVVVGKSGVAFYYVLIVRPKPAAQVGAERLLYERVGAGFIPIGDLKNENILIEVV